MPLLPERAGAQSLLPFLGALITGVGWLLCIPVFLLSLRAVDHNLDSRLFWHLPISFGVSGFISLTHSFFLVELASHRGLFPVLFRGTRADFNPGAMAFPCAPAQCFGHFPRHLPDRLTASLEFRTSHPLQ